MSTLWFDVMSRYSDDPDWSNLPVSGTDRSGLDYYDEYETCRPASQYTSQVEDLDKERSLSGKSLKDFSWLKPPENWKEQHGG